MYGVLEAVNNKWKGPTNTFVLYVNIGNGVGNKKPQNVFM